MSTSREKGELVAKVNPGRLGLMIGAALVALASWSYFADSDLKSRTLGAVTLPLGVVALISGALLSRRTIRLYRGGVERGGRFIAYGDLQTLRVRVDTVPMKLWQIRTYDFRLDGRNAEGPFATRFKWQVAGSHSPEADNLITAAAAPITERMKKELETRGSVRWAKTAVLAANGLIAEDQGRQVAYADLTDATIQQGLTTGTLVIRGRDDFKVKIKTTGENFFPGYYLLIEKLPPEVAPTMAEADHFRVPVRRTCRLLAAGMLLLALVMLAFPLLAPLDALGQLFTFAFAGLFTLGAVASFLRSRKAE